MSPHPAGDCRETRGVLGNGCRPRGRAEVPEMLGQVSPGDAPVYTDTAPPPQTGDCLEPSPQRAPPVLAQRDCRKNLQPATICLAKQHDFFII
ncbi:hypothetical protein ACCUM_3800 [Candidatus Accumulibacter phosphatis]|uniref:Uncharacterized protein n=1 Tax=Candidatus Accumulibacter phosphatis TaxID=327160 RepID=A0A5S4END5_9PROT|nr:hypothetical protein ACCUM_3800 [Candidatus Accumulibacter phosphatis]